MSGSGSFGVNYKKSYGTGPVFPPAVLLDKGSCPEGEFLFVKASGAVSQYAWVVIDKDGNAAQMSQSNDVGQLQVGVAQVALADGEYAWVFAGGLSGGGVGVGIKGKVAASYTSGADLYTTSTAGQVSSSSSSPAVKVANVVGVESTTPAAAVELQSFGPLKIG